MAFTTFEVGGTHAAQQGVAADDNQVIQIDPRYNLAVSALALTVRPVRCR
jgi:hypothetical protein